MRIPALSILLLATADPRAAANLEYLTLGPMLHWNFSGYRFSSFSVGLEGAYWNYRSEPLEEDDAWGPFPDLSRPGYGLDFGIEIDKRGLRAYSEPQLGWIFAGLSAGPVAQLSWRGGPSFGLQASCWVNSLMGFDFRYRRQDGRRHESLGWYAKLPVNLSGEAAGPR